MNFVPPHKSNRFSNKSGMERVKFKVIEVGGNRVGGTNLHSPFTKNTPDYRSNDGASTLMDKLVNTTPFELPILKPSLKRPQDFLSP